MTDENNEGKATDFDADDGSIEIGGSPAQTYERAMEIFNKYTETNPPDESGHWSVRHDFEKILETEFETAIEEYGHLVIAIDNLHAVMTMLKLLMQVKHQREITHAHLDDSPIKEFMSVLVINSIIGGIEKAVEEKDGGDSSIPPVRRPFGPESGAELN